MVYWEGKLGVEGRVEALAGYLHRTNRSWSTVPRTHEVFQETTLFFAIPVICLHHKALHAFEELFKVSDHYKSSK